MAARSVQLLHLLVLIPLSDAFVLKKSVRDVLVVRAGEKDVEDCQNLVVNDQFCDDVENPSIQRRDFAWTVLATTATPAIMLASPFAVQAANSSPSSSPVINANIQGRLSVVTDPNTYSAIVYANPNSNNAKTGGEAGKVPLLVVLHGAGKNQDGVGSLADPKGEHGGLIPSLIASNQAPDILTDNFVVVAPYVGGGKLSFYEEPRSKLLKFVDWVCSPDGQKAGCPSNVDPSSIFLFGFSDGATVAVELATTRKFKASVICAYGYSGRLPQLALDRLKGIPFWVFHSADDVIFPVAYGDQLVKSLRGVSGDDLVRYSRYDTDQEGFTGNVRGHSVGITASKLPDLYTWMLSIP